MTLTIQPLIDDLYQNLNQHDKLLLTFNPDINF